MANNNKQKREEILGIKFLILYNEVKSLEYKFLRLGNPNNHEPDVLCIDKYSIEIVSFYDNKSQSKNYWEDVKGIKNPFQTTDILLRPEDELLNAIEMKLEKLSRGLYSGVDQSKIILLCYCNSPLFDHRTAEEITSQYQPFKQDNHYGKSFYEIWLMWYEGIDIYRILQLE